MSQYTKWPVVTAGGGGGGGTVTSVNVTSASSTILTATGGPITTSGSITLSFPNQSGNSVFASPANGSAGTPSFRPLVAADFPGGIGTGTVTSVALTAPASILSVSGSPVTSSGTLALTLATQAANSVWAGPITGGPATPTFRSLVAADLPPGTGGSVSSVALAAPAEFVVTGSPVTTTGTLTLTKATQSATFAYIGPTTGGAAQPTFRALIGTDIPPISLTSGVFDTLPIGNGGTNSSTALANNRVMISATGQILEAAAIGANFALVSNANGIPVASVTTTTELAFVSGVTSSIQTQLNAKQATGNYITATTGDVVATGPGSVPATIQPNVVDNTKLAQMPTLTLKGNNTGGTANAADLTVSQVNTMLGDVTTLAAVGATPNANGASISGNTLTLQPADATHPGVVTALTQTFGGNKSFSGATTLGAASATTNNTFIGGLIATTRTITANLTLDTTTNDYIILCNQSAGISITLPTPVNGRIFIIKDISGTANTNNITMVRHAAEKIEGLAASKILQSDWGTWTFTSNGTDWFML